MLQSMKLETLLETVISQNDAKRDFVTSTKDNLRMVQTDEGLRLVLLRDNALELERLDIDENAHKQIAARLQIPGRYYMRLLQDHPDLVAEQVNALFEREPESRMIRVLNDTCRAFLSDRYARIDNYELLSETLPAIVHMPFDHDIISSNVDSHNMTIKAVITDDNFKHEITTARGKPRIMLPGFRLSNSETGKGRLKFEGFFYDSYCTNGCVFGKESAFTVTHTHIGGRVIEGGDFQVISPETQALRMQTIKSELLDSISAVTNPEKVERMASRLRIAASSDQCKNPIAAIDLAVKELPISETEKNGMLETFMRDGDFSQYGLASAITEQANKTDNYDRINELETLGGMVIDLNPTQWQRYVTAEKVAA